MRKFIFLLIFLFFVSPLFAGQDVVTLTMTGGAAAGYTALDATTATETDPDGAITITDATTVTLTNLRTRYIESWVYHDLGVAFFSGDFTIRATVNLSKNDTGGLPFFMVLTKKVADIYAIDTGTAEDDDAVGIDFYSSTLDLSAVLFEDGAETDSSIYDASVDTDYFLTLTRDDDAGTNSTGLITVYICSTAYCTSGGNLLATNTVNCAAGEQNDFRYLFWVSSYNTETPSSAGTSGTIKNLEYKLSLP